VVQGVGLGGVSEPGQQESIGPAIRIGYLLFAKVNTNKLTCSQQHTCSDPPYPCTEIIDRGKEGRHHSITEQNTPPDIEDIVAVIRQDEWVVNADVQLGTRLAKLAKVSQNSPQIQNGQVDTHNCSEGE